MWMVVQAVDAHNFDICFAHPLGPRSRPIAAPTASATAAAAAGGNAHGCPCSSSSHGAFGLGTGGRVWLPPSLFMLKSLRTAPTSCGINNLKLVEENSAVTKGVRKFCRNRRGCYGDSFFVLPFRAWYLWGPGGEGKGQLPSPLPGQICQHTPSRAYIIAWPDS